MMRASSPYSIHQGTHVWLPKQTFKAAPDSLEGRGSMNGLLDIDWAVSGCLPGPCAICLRAVRRI